MPQLSISPDSASVTVQVRILDKSKTDGSGLTGLAYDTPLLTAYYNRERGLSTPITLSALAGTDAAWSSGGFIEIDNVNKPGEYRLDLPNAVFASGARFATVTLRGATNMADCTLMIDLKNESTVASIADGAIKAATFAANALDAVWNALTTTAWVTGSFGKKLADWIVGKVLSYDTNKSPAEQVLLNTTYKLLTDSKGHVTPAAASITADRFAEEAIPASAFAPDAITAIQSGLATSLEIDALPTDAEIVAALNASVVDGTISFANLTKLLLAILAGEASVGTSTVEYKRADGTTAAITVTHDSSGNRTAIVIGDLT